VIETLTTTNNSGTGAIRLKGNEFASAIYGNAGSNVTEGGACNDTLIAKGGHDHIVFSTALKVTTNVDTFSGYTPIAGAAAKTASWYCRVNTT
jgi:Ca2+-binding RTX toxin-like protein